MSNRLDQDREAKLQPVRMQTAIDEINNRNILIEYIDETQIWFNWKGEIVKFFPYSGWASGKSIKDGRGLDNLLKQLK